MGGMGGTGGTGGTGGGLSDRDRERLARARAEAAAKMAAEHDRVESRLAAEHRRIEKLRRRRAPGGPDGTPLTVSGPDGVAVELSIHRSGVFVLFGDVGTAGSDDVGALLFLVVAALGLVSGAVSLFTHRVVFHGGRTVLVHVSGRRRVIKIRTPSEAAATERIQQISDAVRRSGLAALAALAPGRR